MNLKETKGNSSRNTSIKVIDMVVYKPYYNGSLCVTNVPYTLKVDANTSKKRERVREESISSEVFQHLAFIFEYMEKHSLTELDYQSFISTRNTSATMSISVDDREAIIDYVMKEWIEKYYKMSVRVNLDTHVNAKEAEERNILKAKLDFFHSHLEQLPELHQNIITMKYLKLESNGRFPIDDFIYTELHIGKTCYYKHKKEALYWLGLSLLKLNQ